MPGDIYIFGTFLDTTIFGADTLTTGGGYDLFVVKYDTAGQLMWANTYGGPSQEAASSIASDPSGGLFMTGYFFQSTILGNDTLAGTGTASDVFLARFDSNGQIIWAEREGGSSTDQPAQITCGNNGDLYLTAYYQQHSIYGSDTLSSGTGVGTVIARYESSGTLSGVRNIPCVSSASPTSIATDFRGGVYLTGTFFDSCYFPLDTLRSYGANDILLCKYDTAGDYKWSRHAGSNFSSEGSNAVIVDTSGTVYIAGSFFGSCIFNRDTLTGGNLYIAKYDSAGNHIHSFPARGTTFAGMANDSLCGVHVTGSFTSYGIFGPDTFNITTNSGKMTVSRLAECAVVPDVEICLITVDTLSKDVQIVFDKNIPVAFVDSFVIFRAVPGGWFSRVGALDFSALSVFTDTTADVDSMTYDYKIAVKDECGVIGNKSVSHGTIRLQYLGAGDFEWTPYRIDTFAGAVAAYRIYRDDAGNGNFVLIQTVAGNTLSFNDPDYLNYPDARYRIDVSWLTPLVCTPVRSFTTSMSNIEDIRLFTGFNDPTIVEKITLYPNPANDLLTVDVSQVKGFRQLVLRLTDMNGRLLEERRDVSGKVMLDVSLLHAGIYCLQVESPESNGVISRRFLIE
ncbi:MAG: T9SS type A sorting domain-containing protein [Bacteroidota bacterium]